MESIESDKRAGSEVARASARARRRGPRVQLPRVQTREDEIR